MQRVRSGSVPVVLGVMALLVVATIPPNPAVALSVPGKAVFATAHFTTTLPARIAALGRCTGATAAGKLGATSYTGGPPITHAGMTTGGFRCGGANSISHFTAAWERSNNFDGGGSTASSGCSPAWLTGFSDGILRNYLVYTVTDDVPCSRANSSGDLEQPANTWDIYCYSFIVAPHSEHVGAVQAIVATATTTLNQEVKNNTCKV